MKKLGCLIGAGVLGFLLLMGVFFIETYNKLNRLDLDVKEGWSNVETDYQRRVDLIPNLVELVKRYAKHEQKIFTDIAEARTRYAGAPAGSKERQNAMGELEGFFSRLMVIVENYPNLKANEQYTRLMDEWAGTENRIKVSRMRYNEVVKRYNYTARSFMGRFWVGIFGFDKEKAFFEAQKGADVAPSAKDLMGDE